MLVLWFNTHASRDSEKCIQPSWCYIRNHFAGCTFWSAWYAPVVMWVNTDISPVFNSTHHYVVVTLHKESLPECVGFKEVWAQGGWYETPAPTTVVGAQHWKFGKFFDYLFQRNCSNAVPVLRVGLQGAGRYPYRYRYLT